MRNEIEITGHAHGVGLQVRTPGQFAMGVAVDILAYLDEQSGYQVKNTGWKEGFGLEVAAWIPIQADNLVAELQTDGDELCIRQVSGPRSEFEALLDSVVEYLDTYTA